MGIMRGVKAGSLLADGQRALQEGRSVFVPRLNATWGNLEGSVPGWAEEIEALERMGWVLVHWAVVPNKNNGRDAAYPLFRRRQGV